MIFLTPKPIHSFFVFRIQSKKKKLQKKRFLKKSGIGCFNKKNEKKAL